RPRHVADARNPARGSSGAAGALDGCRGRPAATRRRLPGGRGSGIGPQEPACRSRGGRGRPHAQRPWTLRPAGHRDVRPSRRARPDPGDRFRRRSGSAGRIAAPARLRGHPLSRRQRGVTGPGGRPPRGGDGSASFGPVRLMELAGILPGASIAREAQDVEVAGVRSDSRSIRPGDLFVAIRGAKFDGFAHVEDAVARGAVAIVSDRAAKPGVAVPWVRVEAPRRVLGELSARLHGNPSEKLVLSGVTGTNGKTSTATLIEAILARRYGKAGLLATTVYRT